MTNLTDLALDSLTIDSQDIPAPTTQAMTDTGNVTIKHGIVTLNKAGAITATIAPPTAGTDDFKTVTFLALQAQANLIKVTEGFAGGGAGMDTATQTAAVGSTFTIMAYNAHWYIVGSYGLTSVG